MPAKDNGNDNMWHCYHCKKDTLGTFVTEVEGPNSRGTVRVTVTVTCQECGYDIGAVGTGEIELY